MVLILWVGFTQSVSAQGNDCAAATLLTPGASCTPTAGTTAGATQSIPALTCAGFTGNADDDVWYRFTATATAHTITVAGGTGFDAIIDVRSGACNGTNIACADATFTAGTEIVNATGLTVGAQYYIRVYSYATGTTGTFTICVTGSAAAPANDNCNTSTNLTVNSGSACTVTTAGTTIGATQSQAGCVGTADDDVWYRFTATSTTHQITATPGTLADAVLQVFSGTCAGTLTSLGCQDTTIGAAAESTVLSGLTVGTVYYVRVYSYGAAAGVRGTFTICVSTPTAATNDNCGGATSVAVNPGGTCTSTVSGTTIGATQSMVGCSGSADDDVWFSFVATGPNHTVTSTSGTLYDAVIEVFSGSCAGLTSLICIDNTVGFGTESAIISGLVSGTTYYVRIYSYFNVAGDRGTFTLCITTPVPLSNDNCSSAIGLTVNPTESCSVSTSGTTIGATQSMPGCSGTADDDVWYSFVATSTTHTITSVPGTIYDAVLEVFSGTCGALTSVACIDNTIGFGTESSLLTGLTVGATYYIRVYTFYAFAGDAGTFTLCITTSIPCANGPGTGTTSLGCPSVLSGGLGLNGADPSPLDCTSGACVDLEATYLQLGRTTDYIVESIPYLPPYQFDCLANPVSVNVDDIWSPTVTLPFNFCFYGNTYNQCLISSNGVITFDLAANTPGGSSDWSFAENLPNTNLFLNTIFGVYHDIDPSIGGEVGWELITLNTGCRALVAAWNDIPMFSATCNSILYTGMIVLYENTNIIDIYIQEKNVCASWNAGNAIVGLQNATGSMALAAPGRNGLDPDWTVTNEAWRFVPSGTSITTLRWYEGAGTSGPMIGTSDVINVCPSETTTYTAEVTYTLCNGATLIETETATVTIDKNKVWNGSAGTSWFTAANWTPVGVPTAINCIIIPDVTNDPIISSATNALGYSLTVENGGHLTLNPNNNLIITDLVEVQTGGTFNIMNSGSLIQTNNVANIGSINMERITQPMHRYDFTYWNSPVTQASGFTLGNLSPLTLIDKYFSWTPSISGGNGIWIYEPPTTVMNPAKGYIVRAPQTYSPLPAVKVPYTANFIGTPNNGNISCPVSYGSLGPATHQDKWNLLGNPYPSAVSAASFLNHAGNAAILDGTIYFWTHNTTFSTAFPDPFYADYVYNYTASDYASWNKVGGVGTIASSGGPAPNGYIAAGQSFFVKSLAVPGSAVFNNAMRVANNNSQFFRTNENYEAGTIPGDEDLEKHRIWLNMTNESGSFNQLLVGYVQNATLEYDRGFDGTRFSDSDIMFYSIIPGENLVIQGRPLPFNIHDRVPLGYSSINAGEFSIKLDHIDGLFDNQKIYLEDKHLNVIHDMKVSPYVFITEAGTFDNRFVLRYTPGKKPGQNPGTITAIVHNHNLMIRASDIIRKVEIFDMTGKFIRSYTPQTESNVFTGDFDYGEGIYLTKVHCDFGIGTARVANAK